MTLDPCTGKGHQYATDPDATDAVWQYAVYAGDETITCGGQPCNKRYWNVAFGLDPTKDNCTLTSGGSSQCALAANGTLECSGRNTFGQLGNATGTGTYTIYGFTAVTGGVSNWSHPTVGTEHACALRAGEPFCWGSNAYGQLGLGTLTSGANSTPTAVPRPAL